MGWTKAPELARQGVPVFPCKPADKRPLTATGFKDATCDPDIIHLWWTEHPEALIGVPTGARFVVVDADLQHEDARDWLVENQHRIPVTRTHYTRSGGRHWLLKPHELVKCSAGKLGPHIDTRGAGGYIIWWPAHGFEVMHGKVLAGVPEWMLEAVNPPAVTPAREVRPYSGDTSRKRDGIIRTIVRARQGERNTVAFWGACRFSEMVQRGEMSRGDAIALTIEAASRTGLTPREATALAKSAFRKIGV
jgi:Bifunctional DNA primase/polymerase, N-terminal